MDIIIKKADETAIYVSSCDSGILMEISEHFTFYADGYKFMPAYRNKLWDGKIRLYDSRNKKLPYGLLFELLKFAKDHEYSVDIDSNIKNRIPPSKEELYQYANKLSLTYNKQKISPRDYQLSAYSHALSEGRCLVISPTGSGKSLIIYLMSRWFLDNYDEKILIIVPTTSLVEQLTKDFEEYSSVDLEFDAHTTIHKIYSGKEKFNIESRIIITTWQSAIKLPKSWFNQYGMVIGDEAHLFKAKSLNTIMSSLVNAGYRIGTTGTIDGSACNEKVLIGNFGPIHRVITTQELIEKNTLSELKIKCIVLKYADELRKTVSKLDYQSEINTIVEHSARNNFISNLALSQKGNTLVLFNLVVKHGKPLHALIESKAIENQKVFYVSGETNTEDREIIREITEKENNAIIVASTGCFSTGINIRNLHNIIFAAPTKSQIRVLQSIGRGLRKADNGQLTTVYDISDDFSWKKKKNYTLNHAIDRIKIYNSEGFNYKLYEVNI